MAESKQIQSDQSGQSRPETASVAWRLPPGEEVGMVALSQLHQKCVLGEIQLNWGVPGVFLLPFQ